MRRVAIWAALTAWGVWLGAVVFFSAVVAPALFQVFGTTEAGGIVSVLFPLYYRVGEYCAVVVIGAGGWGIWRYRAWPCIRWWMLLGGIALVCNTYAGWVLLPQLSTLRTQRQVIQPVPESVTQEFRRLHGRSMMLNGGVLLCLMGMGVVVARRVGAGAFGEEQP